MSSQLLLVVRRHGWLAGRLCAGSPGAPARIACFQEGRAG